MKISQYAWRILADVNGCYLRWFLIAALAGATFKKRICPYETENAGNLFLTPFLIFFSWRR
jgi:hypothetical protein